MSGEEFYRGIKCTATRLIAIPKGLVKITDDGVDFFIDVKRLNDNLDFISSQVYFQVYGQDNEPVQYKVIGLARKIELIKL